MLIACPECAQQVSDRAAGCPRCGFPIAEHIAEQRAVEQAELERTSRRLTEAYTDCAPCKGRGFVMSHWTDARGDKHQGFSWCERCNETGRLQVVHSAGGFWSVAVGHVEAFIGAEIGPDSPHVDALGPEPPPPPSYPPPGDGTPKDP